MTLSKWQVAAGSVAGRGHVLAGRNNQDAFHWVARGPWLAAVVCDGCSSAPRSEMGAIFGARFAGETLVRRMEAGGDPAAPGFWDQVQADLLAELRWLADALGRGSLGDALLFTVVGAVLAPSGAALFSVGDGVFAWNGETSRLGPFPGNEPPYLAYALHDPRARLLVHRTGPVDHLLVGTDGLADFGPLEEFWTDDRTYGNPDRVRRRLALAARTGRLHDDATLVVIRRRPPCPHS